jgi:hypothetical protein
MSSEKLKAKLDYASRKKHHKIHASKQLVSSADIYGLGYFCGYFTETFCGKIFPGEKTNGRWVYFEEDPKAVTCKTCARLAKKEHAAEQYHLNHILFRTKIQNLMLDIGVNGLRKILKLAKSLPKDYPKDYRDYK